jgi:dTMP kinase
MGRGALITIEGLDGAGKTTLAAGLARELVARGHPVELLREPGGVLASERIRALVKDPALPLGAAAEALLYAAARAQLVQERVRPLLEAGALVLLDRFVDSSLAYQGGGRELGMERVGAINAFATGGLEADLTLFLRVDPSVGVARCAERGGGRDRFDEEGLGFVVRVAAAYESVVRAAPRRVRVLDGERAAAEVLARALAAVEELLGRL